MSIKILGGLAKGRSLFVPKGQLIRPTSVMLKRRVFDSIQDLSDLEFYDLCAGSGAMGLEAWSRGADKCFFLEKNRSVYGILEKNVKLMKEHYTEDFTRRPITIQCGSMEKWLSHPQDCFYRENTILFVDPPYEKHDLYKKDTLRILNDDRMKAQVWIESDKDKGVPLEFWSQHGHEPDKVYKQGGSYIARFLR